MAYIAAVENAAFPNVNLRHTLNSLINNKNGWKKSIKQKVIYQQPFNFHRVSTKKRDKKWSEMLMKLKEIMCQFICRLL